MLVSYNMSMRLQGNSHSYTSVGNHCAYSSQNKRNKTRMSMVIALWASLTKYQTITFIWLPVTSCHYLQLTSSAPTAHVDNCPIKLLDFQPKEHTKFCILAFTHNCRSNHVSLTISCQVLNKQLVLYPICKTWNTLGTFRDLSISQRNLATKDH